MAPVSHETSAALDDAERRLRSDGLRHAADALESRASSAPGDATLFRVLGALRLALGEDRLAHHWLGRAICLDTTDAQGRRLYALALWRLGRLSEATAQLAICLAREPDDLTSLMHLSRLARVLGELDRACEAQDRALQIHPHDADVWMAAGDLARSLGQEETASTAYRAALRLAPEHAEARSAVAGTESGQRRPDRPGP